MRIVHQVAAIVTGVIVWGLFWNLGTSFAQSRFPDHLPADGPVTHVGLLLAFILYSALLSVLAGYLTAALDGTPAMSPVFWLAGIQLAIGILVQAGYWSMFPAWYHLVFLSLVVPATLLGGRLHGGTTTVR